MKPADRPGSLLIFSIITREISVVVARLRSESSDPAGDSLSSGWDRLEYGKSLINAVCRADRLETLVFSRGLVGEFAVLFITRLKRDFLSSSPVDHYRDHFAITV